MKRVAYFLAWVSGLSALLRFSHRRSLTILLYHGVAPRTNDPASIYNYRGKFIDPASFEKQLSYWKKHYTILPLERAFEAMQKGTLSKRALALTFDDGYENTYRHAFPILRKLWLPATVFVTTNFILRGEALWVDRLEYALDAGIGTRAQRAALDAQTREKLKHLDPAIRERTLREFEKKRSLRDFEDERIVYAPLTLAQMKEMEAHGIRFGAHTLTHPILSHMGEQEAADEIEKSKHDLEIHGFSLSPVFAYPNGQSGDWNGWTELALQKMGFAAALTTVEGWNTARTPPYRLHRFAMDRTGESIAEFAGIASGVRLYLSRIKKIFL